MADAQGAAAEMPRYRSHKEVWALKIQDVTGTVLSFTEGAYAPIDVGAAYVAKHQPRAGGYYVVYDDGYKSWSPARAFEEGYTRV